MASEYFEYTPNVNGIREVLNGKEACGICTQVANQIAARANGMFDASGYKVDGGRPGKNRAHAIVYTGDLHTIRSNRLHNTLQKSLNG